MRDLRREVAGGGRHLRVVAHDGDPRHLVVEIGQHATQPAALWVWRAGFEERYHGLYSAGPVWSTAVLEVLGADFVRTARAKGLRERTVIVGHALRNALIPVVTLIGLQAAFLLGGAVVTETMFSWPGVGRLAVGAIVSSDFPTAQGAIMILAIAFLSINLLVDVLYVYLDPRVQRT